MLSITGRPYDTLEEVIGLRGEGQGSLAEFGVAYDELELTASGAWMRTPSMPPWRCRVVDPDPAQLWVQLAAVVVGGNDRPFVRPDSRAPAPLRLLVDNCYGELSSLRNPRGGC